VAISAGVSASKMGMRYLSGLAGSGSRCRFVMIGIDMARSSRNGP